MCRQKWIEVWRMQASWRAASVTLNKKYSIRSWVWQWKLKLWWHLEKLRRALWNCDKGVFAFRERHLTSLKCKWSWTEDFPKKTPSPGSGTATVKPQVQTVYGWEVIRDRVRSKSKHMVTNGTWFFSDSDGNIWPLK